MSKKRVWWSEDEDSEIAFSGSEYEPSEESEEYEDSEDGDDSRYAAHAGVVLICNCLIQGCHCH